MRDSESWLEMLKRSRLGFLFLLICLIILLVASLVCNGWLGYQLMQTTSERDVLGNETKHVEDKRFIELGIYRKEHLLAVAFRDELEHILITTGLDKKPWPGIVRSLRMISDSKIRWGQ